MKRVLLLALCLVAVGCKKDKEQPKVAPAVAVDKPKVEGPAVTPTITNAITFFVPKQAHWWGEFAFSCYAAAIHLQPGNRPSDAFTKISPLVEPALKAADIDLDKDVAAIGAWGCA